MSTGMKFEDWKAQQMKKSFAQEQLAALKELSCIGGNPQLAQDVMNICKPGQVQLAIHFFKSEVERLKMARNNSPESVDQHAHHLEMLADEIDEKEKFDPNLLPKSLMDSRNNWRAKHAILGASELMELHALHLKKKMMRNEEKMKGRARKAS